ncbi:hypothetical protein QP938_11200 [Porticoccaceae bacterium LTM1]|nr:hypothetical protein QP938_11200 [Porticoccaceae bacterium LTM1]
MHKYVIIALSFLAVSLLSYFAIGEDAVKADPEHYTVVLENDKVRVIKIQYGPGEKSVMHTHGPNVSIAMTENKVRMNLPDGTSEEYTLKVGEPMWSDQEEHLPENLSDSPLEVILVEIKE